MVLGGGSRGDEGVNVLATMEYAHMNETFKNQVEMQPGHNFIITIPSIAKFISESDIGGQPISHYPGSNVEDQSTFHQGSMNFEILSSVILILCPSCMKRCFERIRQVTKTRGRIMKLRKEEA